MYSIKTYPEVLLEHHREAKSAPGNAHNGKYLSLVYIENKTAESFEKKMPQAVWKMFKNSLTIQNPKLHLF